ncbi:unnamed protein product, partial [marine sediment metagenome]
VEKTKDKQVTIKANMVTSKLDGSNRTENLMTVQRKGITTFYEEEIEQELRGYYERLYSQGFIKV